MLDEGRHPGTEVEVHAGAVTCDEPTVDLSAMTLEELAAEANSQHTLAAGAMHSLLSHALRAGAALLAVREMDHGSSWKSWCEQHLAFSAATAYNYTRLAAYRSDVEEWMRSLDATSTTAKEFGALNGALRAIQDRPPIALPSSRAWDRRKAHDLAEARRLKAQGLATGEIAKTLGVSDNTVREWVDPAVVDRRRARRRETQKAERAARSALREQERQAERNATAKAAGGLEEKAWTAMLGLLDALDKALAQADPSWRHELRDARGFAHKSADQIQAAMKIKRQA